MLPNASDIAEIESNIAGEVNQFTVDENSLGKIMSVLTNLYSDPEGAVVREYLTNALDSQIEAQQLDPNYIWRPIEVSTPSAFTKQYSVRDFGIGMTADDIKDTYSKYGKSTKESSQAVTGMLGLGSKCALTYTNQFTITGWKNGVKTVALVSKNEDGIPVFQIVSETENYEPTGVQISVPVRDRNSFATKTEALLRWWKDGQVLVDGKEPRKHGYEHIKDAPVECRVMVRGIPKTVTRQAGVYLIHNNGGFGGAQSFVVMGNVPYAVDAEHTPDILQQGRIGFVAFVPMGAVDFPPNRETLTYTARTKKVLDEIGKGLYDHILQKHVKAIADAPSFQEAWRVREAVPYPFKSDAAISKMQYRGYDFNERFQHEHIILDWDWQGHGNTSSRTWADVGTWIGGALVVTGLDTEKPTSYFKKKVNYYLQLKSIAADRAMLVKDDPDNIWLAHLPRVTSDTIKALKLPKDPSAVSAGPRAEAPFDYLWVDSSDVVQSDSQVNVVTQPGTQLVYISPADMRETYRKSGCTDSNLVKELGPGCTLVVLGKNRFEKFLRAYPNAIKVSAYADQRVKALVKASNDIDGILSDIGEYAVKFLAALNPADVADPDVKALITAAKTGGSGNYEKALKLVGYVRRADIHLSIPQRPKAKFELMKRYPLLANVDYNSHNSRVERLHYTCYLNAAYKTLVKTKP